MKQVKPISKQVSKIQELLIFILSISFSFTVFFFSPSELALRNQKDFIINSSHIILTMLVLSLIIAAASAVLLNIFLLIHKKLFDIVCRILSGLMLAFYVQELFLNGKMNLLTGDDPDINISALGYAVNFIIACVLFSLPFLLHSPEKNHQKAKNGRSYTLHYVSGLIFVMQLFGFIGTAVQFGTDRFNRANDHFFSYKPSMSLSKENNIVVFLEDRLDSFYMDETLEAYPDLYQELDGFTFYQNNTSHYLHTFPSVTHMFTSEAYNDEEWNEYFKKAWANRNFLDELKQNDYHVNLFISNLSAYNSYTDLEDRCDSIESIDDKNNRINYIGKNGIVPVMTRLSLDRLLPYCAKGLLTADITSDFSSEFISFDDAGLMTNAIGSRSDLKYYDYLTSNGLTDDNPKKTFTFIHLNGAHDRSRDVSRLYGDKYTGGSFDTLSTLRGEFEIVFEYIRQMKELGIYDQSTIIILGDHGRPPREIEQEISEVLTEPVVTSLLIKPAKAESAPLKLDQSSGLSNDYFAASILDYAGIDHEKYGYSYSDIIENNICEERIVESYINTPSVYKINGDARDFSNWKIVN